MVVKRYSKYNRKNMKYAMIQKGPLIIVIPLRNDSNKSKRKTKRTGGMPANITDKKNLIMDLVNDPNTYTTVLSKNPDSGYDVIMKDIRKKPDVYANNLPDSKYLEIKPKGESKDKAAQLTSLLSTFKKIKDKSEKVSSTLAQLESEELITPEQKDKIMRTLDNNEPSTIRKIGQGTLNAFANAANVLGNWFAPPLEDSSKPLDPNKGNIQILWMPRTNSRYKKTPDASLPKGFDESITEYGDFMVYVDKDHYSSTWESLKQQFNGVDDIFADVLNGFSGADKIRRTPIKKKTITITDTEPDKEYKTQNAAYEAAKRKL